MTMASSSRVSILTPTFNAEKYLSQCLDSVLAQTYPHVEHVIADGGSTDGTLDTLREYQQKYPGRIKFVSGPDNGVGSALNKAYRLSSGDILGGIDADDIYQPDAVATAVRHY